MWVRGPRLRSVLAPGRQQALAWRRRPWLRHTRSRLPPPPNGVTDDMPLSISTFLTVCAHTFHRVRMHNCPAAGLHCPSDSEASTTICIAPRHSLRPYELSYIYSRTLQDPALLAEPSGPFGNCPVPLSAATVPHPSRLNAGSAQSGLCKMIWRAPGHAEP